MKQKLVSCLSVLPILAAVCGCAPHAADRSLAQWLARDADSCLRVHTDLYPALYRCRQYDSLERIYTRLMRAMPENPACGRDGEYLAGWVVSYYYNALILQDKTVRGGGILRQPDAKPQSVLGRPYAARAARGGREILPCRGPER